MSRTVDIYKRHTGEHIKTFDFSHLSGGQLDRALDRMLMKVDWEKFFQIDSGWDEDELAAERASLARIQARHAEHGPENER